MQGDSGGDEQGVFLPDSMAERPEILDLQVCKDCRSCIALISKALHVIVRDLR